MNCHSMRFPYGASTTGDPRTGGSPENWLRKTNCFTCIVGFNMRRCIATQQASFGSINDFRALRRIPCRMSRAHSAPTRAQRNSPGGAHVALVKALFGNYVWPPKTTPMKTPFQTPLFSPPNDPCKSHVQVGHTRTKSRNCLVRRSAAASCVARMSLALATSSSRCL